MAGSQALFPNVDFGRESEVSRFLGLMPLLFEDLTVLLRNDFERFLYGINPLIGDLFATQPWRRREASVRTRKLVQLSSGTSGKIYELRV